MPNKKNNKRPGPFATIMDLICEHGEFEVLQSVSDFAQYNEEDESLDTEYRLFSRRLHSALEQLISNVSTLRGTGRGDVQYGQGEDKRSARLTVFCNFFHFFHFSNRRLVYFLDATISGA